MVSGVRCRVSEDRRQRTEDRGQIAEVGSRNTACDELSRIEVKKSKAHFRHIGGFPAAAGFP